MWWNGRFTSWMCKRQIYSNCVMLSCQYGTKSLRNVSKTLLNLCHRELRQFWRQRGVQLSTSKVYLIKWPVSVCIYIYIYIYIYICMYIYIYIYIYVCICIYIYICMYMYIYIYIYIYKMCILFIFFDYAIWFLYTVFTPYTYIKIKTYKK